MQNPRWHHALLLATSLVFYAWATHWLGISFNRTYFWSTPDAQTYKSTMDWWLHDRFTTAFQTRPWGYGAFLALAFSLGEEQACGLFQLVFWLGTLQLMFWAVRSATSNLKAAWVCALLMMLNLTFVVLTAHGLTEVLTTFLVAVGTAWTVRSTAGIQRPVFWPVLLLIVCMLTLLRPVFEPLLWMCALFALRAAWPLSRGWMAVLCIGLCALAIGYQMHLVEAQTGRYKISFIGERTFGWFLVPQTYMHVNTIPLQAASQAVQDWNREQQILFLLQHPFTTLSCYYDNVLESIKGLANLLYTNQPFSRSWMSFLNGFMYRLHTLLPFVLLWAWRAGWRWPERNVRMLWIGWALIWLYMVATSGISFWQGDRLLLPLWPLFLVGYGWMAWWWLQRANRRQAGI
jgi:hypothetical protein